MYSNKLTVASDIVERILCNEENLREVELFILMLTCCT